ncbi:unnamed protein product [[Actinomadura] parvosata subsp. kistnae]|uniref:Uncharacterized protein n=1 Tax=[Actinomadura] parvosata subsp. kistnae TaxID=1909395 RepID=A0A1V0A352_9ACTN|nr:DUF6461 domain-containing protein [Nonomuraea sp. ATCC 55076]AQZ64634.1 hypothetical protein BKM31_27060 [Nonomuraea sp. ATCC 55076]SPL99527.1 unnamed protein product [Actinomadura parvosata subsp. kistnae]
MAAPPLDVLRHYRALLAGDPRLSVALCWVAVTAPNLDVQGVADRLHGRPRTSLREAVSPWEVPPDGPPHPSVGLAPGGIGIFEQNGYLAASPACLSRVSAGGRACGVYWDVDGNNRLTFAAGGRIVLSVDAMEPEDRDGEVTAEVAPGVAALEGVVAADDEEWQQGALVAVELYTGVRLTSQWLGSPHPYAVLARPAPPGATAEPLDDPDTVLRRSFARAGASAQWAVIRELAGELRGRFGLGEYAVADDVLESLARRSAFSDADRLREELTWPLTGAWREREGEVPQEEDPRWRRMQAGRALTVLAGGPGHRAKGFDAFHHAGLALGAGWDEVRAGLLRLLG